MIRLQKNTLHKVSALFIAAYLVLCFSSSYAQISNSDTGKITGKIVDAKTGETIIGANIVITGTSQGDATDIDGTYTIQEVPPGTYSLTISYISYSQKIITGVEVNAGEVTRLDATLQPESVEMGEVTVTAEAAENTEAGLLSMQRKSVPMQDGLSAELISKTGDGDVGSAMKRVTGVSVQNGKDIFVRGLGNRYSNIQLNGSQVPSTNPNQKEAPTDLFGSGLVESIMVQKTYTADQFAEFSGGSVKIVTKEFPYERNFSLSYSTSYNNIATFENTLTSPGSATDFLGYDNGKRNLPSVLNSQRVSEQNAPSVVNGLHNDWNITNNKKGLPSQSFSVNYANQFNENKMPIGVVSNFSYKFSREPRPNQNKRFVQFFNQNGEPNFITNYVQDEGVETAELSGMLNLFVKPSSVTKVGLKTMYSNSTTNSRSVIEGPYQNGITRQTVLDFDRRTIFSSTLEAETYFENFMSSKLFGHISYNKAMRIRPDRRTTRYNLVGGNYQFQSFGDNNGHFFSDQDDNNYSGEIKYELKPFEFLDVSAGGNIIVKDRRFTARRITYRDQIAPFVVGSDIGTAPAGVVLQDEHIYKGGTPDNDDYLELTETTQFGLNQSDWYDGFQTIYAGFLSTKWNIVDNFSFQLGGRIEQSTQAINVPLELGGKYQEVSRVENTDFLPAVNATYEINDETNLRAAYSRTLARPAFREISNFNFADFLGGQRVYGNPELQQTNITNYDLRFETYPNPGELFAVSAFYKHFNKPIELFYRLTDANEVFYDNAPEADLFGLEIEGRKNVTERLQVVANASYIFSETRMSESAANRVANIERPMLGQSPHIINTSVFYVFPRQNIDMSVSYNTFGERIITVGKNGQQYDEKEQPFHDLSAKIDYSLGQVNLSLEVSNILNQQKEYKIGPATTYQFKPGVTFDVGLAISL